MSLLSCSFLPLLLLLLLVVVVMRQCRGTGILSRLHWPGGRGCETTARPAPAEKRFGPTCVYGCNQSAQG